MDGAPLNGYLGSPPLSQHVLLDYRVRLRVNPAFIFDPPSCIIFSEERPVNPSPSMEYRRTKRRRSSSTARSILDSRVLFRDAPSLPSFDCLVRSVRRLTLQAKAQRCAQTRTEFGNLDLQHSMAAYPPEQFNTWSEIAGYLSISVREAQYRERNEGLPVRRLVGKKPRVWALRSELD